MLKSLIKQVMNAPASAMARREYRLQNFKRLNERPVEFAFLFRKMSELYPLRILDIGTGTTALPHVVRTCGSLVTATDNVRDYWPRGMANRHYHVVDDDITDTRLEGPFDMVTCISVLEHIDDSDAAVRNMFSLLDEDGDLILTFPYTEDEYVPNVYDLPGSSYGQSNPFRTQSYSRAELDRWLEQNDAVIVEQELWQFWDGDYWTVGNQVLPPRRARPEEKHQHTCLHLRRR